MTITASQVKELRDRTGLGMMECKKALTESVGDMELAIENLRKSGQAKAAKKAGRTAAEGVVIASFTEGYGLLVEINSETDFLARDQNFLNFAQQVSACLLASRETDVARILALPFDTTQTIEAARQSLVQKIGENIQIRRVEALSAPTVGAYVHNGKIAALVGLTGGSVDLAKDIAMHVTAATPLVVNPSQVPAELLAKEREIFAAQAQDSGKPPAIIEKMIDGRVNKFLSEVSLISQPFVKDSDVTVGALAKAAGAEVVAFVRFEVGDGIERETVDFAAEVMAQVQKSL